MISAIPPTQARTAGQLLLEVPQGARLGARNRARNGGGLRDDEPGAGCDGGRSAPHRVVAGRPLESCGRHCRMQRDGRRRALKAGAGPRCTNASSIDTRSSSWRSRSASRMDPRVGPSRCDALSSSMGRDVRRPQSRTRAGRQASRASLIRAASDGPIPGTAAICSTGASRTRFAEPNTRSSARRRFGPTPGRSSNAERVWRFERRSRWYVIAKRWASSRSRWTRYSADDVGGRTTGVGAAGQEQLLALLGEPRQRQVVEAQLVEDLLGRGDLALAAVDDHEVGHRPAELLGFALLPVPCPPEPSPQDLLVRGEVVRSDDRPDLEPAVLARPRLALLEHDHAADRIGALDVRDVVALDPERRPGQLQRRRQLLERRQRLALVGQPAGLLAGERLRRVAGGEGHQLPPLAALRDQQVDRPAAPARQERLEVGPLRQPERHEDLPRDGGRARVELLEEAREDLLVGRVVGRVEEEHVAADRLAVADREQLDRRLVVLPGEADEVELRPAEGRHLLALHRPLDGPDLVPQDRRLLVVGPLGRRPHLGRERLARRSPGGPRGTARSGRSGPGSRPSRRPRCRAPGSA